MSAYAALLRGINVGSGRRVGMAELKASFEKAGLGNVSTYIQSGNVLFVSEEEETPLIQRIEGALLKDFGFPLGIVLRTADELEQILKECPVPAEEAEAARERLGSEVLHAALMAQAPTQADLAKMEAARGQTERFEVSGRDILLFLPEGVHASKLALLLPKLHVPATMRNMKTIRQLALLARQAH